MQNDFSNDIGFQKFVFNPFMENTYLVWDNNSLEAMIIDPGNNNISENNKLEQFISEQDLKVKFLINTHGHIDHIMGNSFVIEKYNPEFYFPEKDSFLYENAQNQAKAFGVNYTGFELSGNRMEDSGGIKIGAIKAEFIFTPGHTPGEYCIYLPGQQLLFAGDVLFLESVGRTDLPGGDMGILLGSIQNKLFSLHDATVVFPGHGQITSIGHEKENNPFFY